MTSSNFLTKPDSSNHLNNNSFKKLPQKPQKPKERPSKYEDLAFKEEMPSKTKETSNSLMKSKKLRSQEENWKSQKGQKDTLKYQELKDKKTRFFDILDKEEELVVSGSIEDLKRDVLLKEFKTLYYKSRELKQLLNEFFESNKGLNIENQALNIELSDKNMKLEAFQLKTQENLENLEKFQALNNEKSREIEDLKRNLDENLNEIEIIKEKLSFFQGETKKSMEKERVFEETRFFANKKEAQIRVFSISQ